MRISNINCKHFDNGACDKLPKTLWLFRKKCVLILDQTKCKLQDKWERPKGMPPPPPPIYSPHPRARQPKQESILPRVSLSTPMPPVKPPKNNHDKQLETLILIEKHLSEIASCVKSAPLHGTGKVIKTANWNA